LRCACHRTFVCPTPDAAAVRDSVRPFLTEYVTPVATLMWNIQPHLEAYLAVPAMGAVLHTLNARYTNEQIAFTARHAGDRVILADATLLGRLLAVLPALGNVEHVVGR
jgi:fatty-acyl-CoA synthase